jgi:hypothetical protein
MDETMSFFCTCDSAKKAIRIGIAFSNGFQYDGSERKRFIRECIMGCQWLFGSGFYTRRWRK